MRLRWKFFQTTTSWFTHLLPSFGLLIVLLVFAIILTSINGVFSVQKQNANNMGLVFYFGSISFPLLVILGVLEVFILVYFCFNWVNWLFASLRAYQRRKRFNLFFLAFSSCLLILLLFDTLLRCIYVFSTLPFYWNNFNTTTLVFSTIDLIHQPFGSFYASPYLALGTFGFNSLLLLLLSLVGGSGLLFFWLLQKRWFFAEKLEKNNQAIQNNYRGVNLKLLTKYFRKRKPDGFDQKITTF